VTREPRVEGDGRQRRHPGWSPPELISGELNRGDPTQTMLTSMSFREGLCLLMCFEEVKQRAVVENFLELRL
jgi:hypothetical protein